MQLLPRPGGPGQRVAPWGLGPFCTLLSRTDYYKLGNFLRPRFLVSSDVPNAIAFCRTAPSVRPNLPAICLAGAFFAKDLSSRMSFAVHPRRFAIGSPYAVIP